MTTNAGASEPAKVAPKKEGEDDGLEGDVGGEGGAPKEPQTVK